MSDLPLIVLIHAFPTDGSLWHHQTEALEDKGYRVLTPHLPGFGAGAGGRGAVPAWPMADYSMESLARFVRDIIVKEAGSGGAGRAIVGGCSMGGCVLLGLLRHFPEVVRGAMFMDCRAEDDTPEARANRLKSIATIEAEGNIRLLVEAMLPRLLSSNAAPELREELRGLMMRQSPQGVMGIQYALAQRPNETALLAELQIPVLMLVGAEDITSPPSVMMAMFAQLRAGVGTLVQIAQAGHLPMLEAPERVTEAMGAFLQTCGQ